MKNGICQIRAFIAVSLPDHVKLFLNDLQNRLKQSGIKASWPKPAAMHLTVKFLGDLPADQVEMVKTCMEKAAAASDDHTVSASGIGVFSSIKNARVLWSGIRGQTDALERLVSKLDRQLFDTLGMPKASKRFSPHLTLARVKRPIHPKRVIRLLQEFQNFHSKKFVVSEIMLFKSELSSSGAIHDRLFSTKLGN